MNMRQQMPRKKILRLAACLAATATLHSCAAVKPYQRGRLNDADMELSIRKVERMDASFQTYREGASGANGGKAGGGCGCN